MKFLLFFIVHTVRLKSDIIRNANHAVANTAVIEKEFDEGLASVAKIRHQLIDTLNGSTVALKEVNLSFLCFIVAALNQLSGSIRTSSEF